MASRVIFGPIVSDNDSGIQTAGVIRRPVEETHCMQFAIPAHAGHCGANGLATASACSGFAFL